MTKTHVTRYNDGGWCEQEYVDGRLHGRWTVFFPNGNKNWERLYENDRQEGYQRHWNETGDLVEERLYHLGELHGPWRKWDENRREELVGQFYLGYPLTDFEVTCNPEFNSSIKPSFGLEPSEVAGQIDQLLSKMARPTLRMQKETLEIGFEPSQMGSYWSHVNRLGENEQWPAFDGQPLFPILQLNCDEITIADSPLKQFSLVTLFAVDDIAQKFGEDIVLRAYRSSEKLVPVIPPRQPLDEPSRLTFVECDSIYPDKNDLPPGVIAYLSDQDQESIFQHDEKLLSRIGGWPGWLQNSRMAWLDSFVMQVDSLDVEYWNCGDCTVHYFFLDPAGEEFTWGQEMC